MNKFNERVMPYINCEDAHDMDPESGAAIGWGECKNAILEILNQPIQNADLSWEEIDTRFIEKIERDI